jgi:hypothetical protein
MTSRKITLLVGALLTIGGASLAAAKGNPPQTSIPKEISVLRPLVGAWEGSGTCEMAGQTHTARVTMRCEPTAGGFGVACRTSIAGLSPAPAEEHTDLYGFDPGQGKYHWFSVTSAGDTHDHVGQTAADGSIEWAYRGVMQAKQLEERVTMRFSADGNRVELHSRGTLDGAPAWDMKGSATKK